MSTEFKSERAAECAEQLNVLLLIIYENESEGIHKNSPLIGNALNLSAYIHNFFREQELDKTRDRLCGLGGGNHG
ncbi:hypothetical protein F3I27_23675 [Pantoea sp. Bo_2]|uniref:hypothetical protein n=1 Tax=unclassified Pantoea TaxID=2630326 RepID=UPI001231F7F3|nr:MULTISPECIES: hypothetical protein [unclassified Pantoea]KAA6052782.1 hypothetical protein F3I32_23705 [Pantoea sp. Bo_40]KAA6078536.1 hypothetical protein F3I30_23820 [Pantoea sp. Bo_34a]KAA6043844.1 hypothetical protein F3I34_23685 [Pantoea sp. Bo_5]KAA6052747.1 hypothetical protein F3I33_23720 [Pantoea sp. Bo_46]KAA6057096.1 hypothetical protein F3I29_23175 [Pantoea sp. Bo_3]